MRERLTPRHRLRQLEPSWLRSGQTTSLLLESVREKDEVKDERGGILTPPCGVFVSRSKRRAMTRVRMRVTVKGRVTVTGIQTATGRNRSGQLGRRQRQGAVAFQGEDEMSGLS